MTEEEELRFILEEYARLEAAEKRGCTMPDNEIKLIIDLYETIGVSGGRDEILGQIARDECSCYLTKNKGRDGKEYWSYLDEGHEGAVRISDGEIITDEEELEKLFY